MFTELNEIPTQDRAAFEAVVSTFPTKVNKTVEP
jgi:hypothetical protein